MFPVAVGLALAPAVGLGMGAAARPPDAAPPPSRPPGARRGPVVRGRPGGERRRRAAARPGGGRRPRRGAAGPDRGRPHRAHAARTLRGRLGAARAATGSAAPSSSIGDGFGLAEARIALDRSDEVIVYPRVYPLEGLFTDAGGSSGEHGRALLHRTAGYDLHSIRDHQQGESLRRVHWRSTAKRRKLMVKELQDTPRDEASVLLDGDAQRRRRRGARIGVRLPGARRGIAPAPAGRVGPAQLARDPRRRPHAHPGRRRRRAAGPTALGALAGAQPDAPRSLATALGESAHAPTRVDAARVYVVTAAMSAALAERLLGAPLGAARRRRRLGRRARLRGKRSRHRPERGGAPPDPVRRPDGPDPARRRRRPGALGARRSGWWWPVPDRRIGLARSSPWR